MLYKIELGVFIHLVSSNAPPLYVPLSGLPFRAVRKGCTTIRCIMELIDAWVACHLADTKPPREILARIQRLCKLPDSHPETSHLLRCELLIVAPEAFALFMRWQDLAVELSSQQ